MGRRTGAALGRATVDALRRAPSLRPAALGTATARRIVLAHEQEDGDPGERDDEKTAPRGDGACVQSRISREETNTTSESLPPVDETARRGALFLPGRRAA